MKGIIKGCKLSNCELVGGETAEMPDFYQDGEYDISGTIIGVVDKEFMMPLRKTKKGDVLATARIAGVMAAKSTSQLIPMCHPINLDNVGVELLLDEDRSTVEISATVKTTSKTGVEMEAMTAVSVAALTVYDMCKSEDRGIRIGDIRLARKMGGKSGNIVLEE